MKDAIRECYSTVIRELAAIVNAPQTDDMLEKELLPRDPVMENVSRIREAMDKLSAAQHADARGGGVDAEIANGNYIDIVPGTFVRHPKMLSGRTDLEHGRYVRITAAPEPPTAAVVPVTDGLTPKQAWWAGYRAGKGLPPDTPRAELPALPGYVRNALAAIERSWMPHHAVTLRDYISGLARPGAVDEDATRVEFERWVSKRWGFPTVKWADSGEYKYGNTRDWWECWKTALTAAQMPAEAGGVEASPFDPNWPQGLEQNQTYELRCDDKGRNGGSWLRVFVANDGDVHLMMQDWEEVPNGEPAPFPSIRCRNYFGGGRNERSHQALLWLAQAIRLDAAGRTKATAADQGEEGRDA